VGPDKSLCPRDYSRFVHGLLALPATVVWSLRHSGVIQRQLRQATATKLPGRVLILENLCNTFKMPDLAEEPLAGMDTIAILLPVGVHSMNGLLIRKSHNLLTLKHLPRTSRLQLQLIRGVLPRLAIEVEMSYHHLP